MEGTTFEKDMTKLFRFLCNGPILSRPTEVTVSVVSYYFTKVFNQLFILILTVVKNWWIVYLQCHVCN